MLPSVTRWCRWMPSTLRSPTSTPSLAEVRLGRLVELRLLRDQKAERERSAAAHLSRRWRTPGQMAKALDPNTVQTPALDLIDQALVDLADGAGRKRPP